MHPQKRLTYWPFGSSGGGAMKKQEQAQGGTFPNYEQGLSRLLSLGERLCGQTQGVGERLAHEVTKITQGQAQLVLYCRETASQLSQPPPLAGSSSFPVQFRDLTYGTLYVRTDPAEPTQLLIPPAKARVLAQLCGDIMYLLEVSALLQFQYQRLSPQACEHLTRREQEVLKLLCQGYDQETIAELLHIAPATVVTHRQRIYAKLHVHDGHDLLLAAFRAGLFSPLAGVSSFRSPL
jgi:DNA-binding CsgD family transcriptional regulator